MYDMTSGVLAAAVVYLEHDAAFAILSAIFIIPTFLVYWALGNLISTGQSNLDARKIAPRWGWTLHAPVLSMATITMHYPKCCVIALVFGSFPQYILSLSFVLVHGVADFFNVMALTTSLLQLLTSPMFAATLAYLQSVADAKGLYEGKRTKRAPTACRKVYFGITLLFGCFVAACPVLMMGLVHACPTSFPGALHCQDGQSELE